MESSFTGSEDSLSVQQELTARRATNERMLRQRLERAKDEGELPEDASPAELARYFSTVQQGFSVQTIGGASQEDLIRVVEIALRAWPN